MPYLKNATSYSVNVLWILVPTAIWSLTFEALILCIDPLLLPFIQRRVGVKAGRAIRVVWVSIFAVALLFNWNITPDSYLFYLSETLSDSPLRVTFGIGVGALVLLGMVLFDPARTSTTKFAKVSLLLGLLLITSKLLLSSGLVSVDHINRALKSPVAMITKLASVKLSAGHEINADKTPDHSFLKFTRGQKAVPDKVVLMIVESWSETSQTLAMMRDELARNGVNVIRTGFTTYQGATLQGEFRELCGKYIALSQGLADDQPIAECAPRYFRNKGYKTIGIHGYAGNFYARKIIWKKFGFSETFFEKDLQNLSHCEGAFYGICDEDVIRYGLAKLDEGNLTFLYMLTLVSHEPVNMALLSSKTKYFNALPAEVHAQNLARRAISTLVDGLQAKGVDACTSVYVAGDHAPPSLADRGSLEPGKVPFMAMLFNCGN